MDKLCNERDKYKEKGDARLTATETKLTSATASYEELNEELKKDIPVLLEQAESFFQPLILLLIVNQGSFWGSMSQFTNTLSQRVDSSQAYVPDIIQVVTPKNQSAINKKYSAVGNNPWAGPAPALAPPPHGLGPTPAITYNAPQYGMAPTPVPGGHTTPYSPPGGNPYGGGGRGATQPAHNPFTQPAVNPFAGTAPVVSPRPPPRVPTAPGALPQAKGLWDFTGENESELTFRAGEIISIHAQQGDWWSGELHGRTGLFPSNYVQLL